MTTIEDIMQNLVQVVSVKLPKKVPEKENAITDLLHVICVFCRKEVSLEKLRDVAQKMVIAAHEFRLCGAIPKLESCPGVKISSKAKILDCLFPGEG